MTKIHPATMYKLYMWAQPTDWQSKENSAVMHKLQLAPSDGKCWHYNLNELNIAGLQYVEIECLVRNVGCKLYTCVNAAWVLSALCKVAGVVGPLKICRYAVITPQAGSRHQLLAKAGQLTGRYIDRTGIQECWVHICEIENIYHFKQFHWYHYDMLQW